MSPRTKTEVNSLLDRLDDVAAHDLEFQHLDFKEWDTRSLSQSLRTVVTSAVCMANGTDGTVVFGVADKTASRLCQRRESAVAAVLARMESELGYVEHRGSGPGAYWTLSPEAHARLAPANDFREGPKVIFGADGAVTHRDPHGVWDGLKARVIQVIRRCAETGADPFVNADVRRITGLYRHQVRRMIHEFRDDGLVVIEGHGRAARYLYAGPGSE